MMFSRKEKTDERAEYRSQQTELANNSPSLAERFPELKALTFELGQYDSSGASRTSQIKYSLNLPHARSVFRIHCGNTECVRGDFDLSEPISEAVGDRRDIVSGELCCRGWLSKTTIGTARCGKILRYKLHLEYS